MVDTYLGLRGDLDSHMRHPSDQPTANVDPRCPVCRDTGRASVKTIDEVSMVAWCRCPAGARALDHELAQRRSGGPSPTPAWAPPPPPPVLQRATAAPAPVTPREPPVGFGEPLLAPETAGRYEVRAAPRASIAAARPPAPPPSPWTPVSMAGEASASFGPAAAPALRGPEPEPIPLRPVHEHRPSIHVVTRDAADAGARAARPAQLPEAYVVAVGYKADERLGVMCYLTLRIRGEQIEVPCDRETADVFAANLSAGRSPRYRLALEPSRD